MASIGVFQGSTCECAHDQISTTFKLECVYLKSCCYQCCVMLSCTGSVYHFVSAKREAPKNRRPCLPALPLYSLCQRATTSCQILFLFLHHIACSRFVLSSRCQLSRHGLCVADRQLLCQLPYLQTSRAVMVLLFVVHSVNLLGSHRSDCGTHSASNSKPLQDQTRSTMK